ncbi:hypothetical protein B0H10DRAFT_2195766 [Mycena sp. CBHHK59/15]|nr:hypothetical protein B0H10DRAFT_2195766 [Mycena sp. CBHHK59/15]
MSRLYSLIPRKQMVETGAMRQRVPANAEPLITHAYQSEDASLIGGYLEENRPIDYFGSPLMPSPILAPSVGDQAMPTIHLPAPAIQPPTPQARRLTVATASVQRSMLVKILRDSIVIVDEQDHIVAALPGHPPGADWDESIRKMSDCFRKVREETANCFTYEDLHHCRGNFASINYGNSFGAGQRCPGTLKQSHKAKEEAVKMLSSEPWALRFSAFQSHAFGPNFPQEFTHYKVILGPLIEGRNNETEYRGETYTYGTAHGPRSPAPSGALLLSRPRDLQRQWNTGLPEADSDTRNPVWVNRAKESSDANQWESERWRECGWNERKRNRPIST